MTAVSFRWMLLFLVSLCSCAVRGSSIGTSTINCAVGSVGLVGDVDEGYSGDVEQVNGIPADTNVKLVAFLFPEHVQFLELVHSPGSPGATVRTKVALDADQLKATEGILYYSIMCMNIGKLNNTRTLKVNDLNDNSPVFQLNVYRKTVSETESPDTVVLTVKAEDADQSSSNNRVSYSIVPPASPDFTVRTSDGAFQLIRRLNYNTVRNYNYTVQAEDSGGLSDRATVLIDVEDFDNMNPYFDHSHYQASIPEEQIGVLPTILPEAIKAQDGDTGINVPVVYSISAVSPSQYLSKFNIDANSGVISVMTGLDRELIGEVTINIKATQQDDNLKFANAFVTVTIEDVNDNEPVFDKSSYSATLLENSPKDTVIFRVQVTDLDQSGFNGTLRLLPESVPFSVSLDGTVSVKSPAELDRETVGSFTFQIVAREADTPNRVVSADVNVTLLDENDNSPQFGSPQYEGKVFPNQTEGMQIVRVEATDLDAGSNGQVTYSIDFGNQEGYFSINENTGEITLNKIIPFEENRLLEFSLYVTATDGGVVSRSSSVLVAVLAPGDSKPRFLQKTYHGSVEEDMEPGATVLKVGFVAVPTVVSVTLQVLTDADKFAIDPNGVFTTKIKLDHETKKNYSVRISISDGSSNDEAVVEVQVTDINDNSPVFADSPVTRTIPEDTELGANITSVIATDADDGFNGEVRYSLRGGEGKFAIDPESGLVTLTGPLDRETRAEFSLEVIGQDQGRPSRSATASLLIQVSDVNDNPPRFSESEYQVEVFENDSVGATLVNLTAVDPDEGPNAAVTYSVVSQDPASDPAVFELDSSTGVLRLAHVLDYGVARGYRLAVKAEDGGTPPLEGLSTVVVRVKDVNNNRPRFSKESYDVAVSENVAGGASIVTLVVTDEDEGGFSNGHFVFTSDTFNINNEGLVSLKKDATLDRETKAEYILQVTAVDQPVGGLNATAQLNITVLDYNDNTPQFPSLPDPIPVPEGEYSASSPGEVYRILATDADLGANAEVTVSLSAPNSLFTFREDGTLLVVGELDRETRDAYELVVVASDNGTPQRQNITTIRLSVTDVNDNAPVFSAPTYATSILVKDAKVGDVLLTLSATDKDTGDNSLITYSFSAGSSPYLSLNGETGVVTLASDLADVTEDTELDLTAVAQDHGRPPLNSTASVLVFLKTVSLGEGVSFRSPSYNFSVPENVPEGTAVGAVQASSGSSLFDVTIVLTTHTHLFAMDPRGALSTKEMLDREVQEWYILEVKAVDNRIPPTSAVALVRVQVEDVNEAPTFVDETYQGKIFSIAPYKYPVVQVKATDPDNEDSGRLQYSLSEPSPSFDVDPSTGQVYVLSAAGLAGETAVLAVTATDPLGLQATARVEVLVLESASSDVVVVFLNQDINIVEKKVPEMEQSLGGVLGWTVRLIGISSSSGGSDESRTLRKDAKTFVSFIATDGDKAVPAEEIKKKLQSEASSVQTELEKVFGPGLQYGVQVEPALPASNQTIVTALAVLLALSMLGLVIIGVFLVIKFRRDKKQRDDPYRESFAIDNQGHFNSERSSVNSEGRKSVSNDRKSSQEAEPECDRQNGDTSAF